MVRKRFYFAATVVTVTYTMIESGKTERSNYSANFATVVWTSNL